MTEALDLLGRGEDWAHVHAVVAGFDVSGFAAADALVHMGATVVVVDDRDTVDLREKATLLSILGADVRLGAGSSDTLPDVVDVVVTSPGWRPTSPLLAQAAQRGVPIWGEVELAWRLRGENAAPWLCLTGTNGKTTVVQMLDAMCKAAGLRSAAVGNVGFPVSAAVMDPEPYDVLAVELSSFQLHWIQSVSPLASAVLNIAPDHGDWYAGDVARYAADKASIYERTQVAAIYNVQDPATEQMVRDANVVEGCRAVGFTLDVPAVSMVGIVDDMIADRAFVEERETSAAELGSVRDVSPPAPHNVANALAAAALARAAGVPAVAVRDGLRAFQLDAHRIQTVDVIDGVEWVDDSKATNTHAAQAALLSYASVVWIAGGLAKGASFDALVERARARLRGVVLIGRDRTVIAEALRRHAPDVPVFELADGETDPMKRVVEAAASMSRTGDTVLLAPGCASQDMFADYGARGDAFAAAVRTRRARRGE